MLSRRSLFSLLIVLSLTLFSACTDKKSSDNNNSGGDTPPPIVDPNPPVPEGILNENMKVIDGVYIYKNTLHLDHTISANAPETTDVDSPSLMFTVFNYSAVDIPAGKLGLEITDNLDGIFIMPFGAGNCESGIKAGSECEFKVYLYEPKITNAALKTAKLKVTVKGKSDNLTLSVNAIEDNQAVLLEYKNQSFPIYSTNKPLAQATKLTIYARTDTPVIIESVSVANEDERFIETNNNADCSNATLAFASSKESCSVPFDITPKTTALSTATITVKTKGGKEYKVPVYIEATEDPVLSILVETTTPTGHSALTAGLVNNIGKVPATEHMTAKAAIRNESNSEITGITFGAFNSSSGMAIADRGRLDLCTTLAKGAECSFNITLDNARYGEQTATMDITYNNGITKQMTFTAEVVPALLADNNSRYDADLYKIMLEADINWYADLKLYGATKNLTYTLELPQGYNTPYAVSGTDCVKDVLKAGQECYITVGYNVAIGSGFVSGLNKHTITAKMNDGTKNYDVQTQLLINMVAP